MKQLILNIPILIEESVSVSDVDGDMMLFLKVFVLVILAGIILTVVVILIANEDSRDICVSIVTYPFLLLAVIKDIIAEKTEGRIATSKSYKTMRRFTKICASMPESPDAILISISLDCIWDVICRTYFDVSERKRKKEFYKAVHETYKRWNERLIIREFMSGITTGKIDLLNCNEDAIKQVTFECYNYCPYDIKAYRDKFLQAEKEKKINLEKGGE